MSKVRGVLPLFLVTGIGIGNGIYVFRPAFEEQQKEGQGLAKKAAEVEQKSEDPQIEALRKEEVAASRSSATEAALKPIEPSSTSWWPRMSLWSTAARKDDKPLENKLSPDDDGKPGKVA